MLDAAGRFRNPLLDERLDRLALLLPEDGCQIPPVEIGERREVRAREVLADLRLEHPPRRERAREARDDHLGHVELLREERCVHRPGAAERDERELARLDPLLDRERPDRLRHLGVDHVADPLGELDRLQVQLVGELGDRASRRVDVERHLAACEPGRIDATEDEVRIGDRRLRAAAPVARGARIGARALRTDAQSARLRVGDRAAARAHGVDVHDRHQQREPFERRLRRDVRPAVDDERDVEARAAHVDADQVRPVEHPRERDAAHRAADRAREERLERHLARGLGADDPAARLRAVHGADCSTTSGGVYPRRPDRRDKPGGSPWLVTPATRGRGPGWSRAAG